MLKIFLAVLLFLGDANVIDLNSRFCIKCGCRTIAMSCSTHEGNARPKFRGLCNCKCHSGWCNWNF